MNKIAKIIAIAFAAIIVALLAILAFVNPSPKNTGAPGIISVSPDAYEASPDGRLEITNPLSGQAINSPLVVSGSVVDGGWFFEGTFPVKVVDGRGVVIGEGQAEETKPGAWTSTGTVAFTGTISFSTPRSTTGTVVFSKDNPSGLPQNDESFGVPVRFR